MCIPCYNLCPSVCKLEIGVNKLECCMYLDAARGATKYYHQVPNNQHLCIVWSNYNHGNFCLINTPLTHGSSHMHMDPVNMWATCSRLFAVVSGPIVAFTSALTVLLCITNPTVYCV